MMLILGKMKAFGKLVTIMYISLYICLPLFTIIYLYLTIYLKIFET